MLVRTLNRIKAFKGVWNTSKIVSSPGCNCSMCTIQEKPGLSPWTAAVALSLLEACWSANGWKPLLRYELLQRRSSKFFCLGFCDFSWLSFSRKKFSSETSHLEHLHSSLAFICSCLIQIHTFNELDNYLKLKRSFKLAGLIQIKSSFCDKSMLCSSLSA